MRLLASWRLAAPVALASLLGLGLVRTERLQVARRAIDAAGASTGPGRRRPFLAAVFLGAAAAPAGATDRSSDAALDGVHADRFASLDVDGDGRLSEQEYGALLNGVTDQTALLEHMTLFSQADVDGDDVLSLPEYVFSRFLATEAFNRRVMQRAAGKLPPGFIQGIDDMFLGLRARFPGEVQKAQVQKVLCELIGIDEESFDGEDRLRLHNFFQAADIIPDGVLNLNELDFLHFMIREALVEGALEPLGEDKAAESEVRVAGLYAIFDKNGDGYIDRSEAELMPDYFADSTLEKALFRDHISEAFLMSDVDGNGLVDKVEALKFVNELAGKSRS